MSAASEKSAPERRRRLQGDLDVYDASAWILRVGVVASVSVMLLGLALSFARGVPSVAQMLAQPFQMDFGRILRRAAAGDGLGLIELGILVLVATPILRVASSVVLFAAEERDWFYAAVTFLVLALTLTSLLILR